MGSQTEVLGTSLTKRSGVITMAKRRKMSRKGSRKLFTATAQKVHRKNNIGGVMAGPMRGGIRL